MFSLLHVAIQYFRMVDRSTLKPEEHYPLLKVEGCAGDTGGHPEAIAPAMTPSWIVRCSPKQSWFTRWPG